jgi:hypothetical protein
MRLLRVAASVVVGFGLLHCGKDSPGSASVGPSADGGTTIDGGTGADGGTGSDGGTSDGGTATDGGTASSDCDGLSPGTPGAPSQISLPDQDLVNGQCFPGETDGTGHITVSWQNGYQPHDSRYKFIDPSNAKVVGSHQAAGMYPLIGQASGFIGAECAGSTCQEDYVVLDPVGKELYRSPPGGTGNNVNVNDPTGGMIHVRFSESSAGTTMLLDAIDAAGNIRWTRALPDVFGKGDSRDMRVGVDRQGNVLAVWSSERRYAANAWAGQWFDPAGTPGAVFHAATGSLDKFYERVGSGLFLAGFSAPNQPAWLGQFDAQSTSMSPPPDWLASRPNTALHMVHGGKGYAVLPKPASSAACEQQVGVVSPSGKTCGSSNFSMGGGACSTSSIIVGYDGTVVQQAPRERETCTAAGHQCSCTYRYWPGFFR